RPGHYLRLGAGPGQHDDAEGARRSRADSRQFAAERHPRAGSQADGRDLDHTGELYGRLTSSCSAFSFSKPSVYVIDCITDRLDLVRLMIWDADIEFFLQFHEDLNHLK